MSLDNSSGICRYNDQGVKFYDIEHLNKKQCRRVEYFCNKESRYDRAKAIGWTAFGAIGTLLLLNISFSVSKLFYVILAVTLTPLAPVFFPAYFIICVGSGLIAGGIFGYLTLKALWSMLCPKIVEHWRAANHFSEQANLCNDRLISFIGNKPRT